MPDFSPVIWIYVLAALGAILAAEAVFLLIARQTDRRSDINRRVRLSSKTASKMDVLTQLRKERGIGDEDVGRFSLKGLARLRTQSGLRMAPLPFVLICCAVCSMVGAFAWLKTGQIWLLPASAFIGLTVAPYKALSFLRTRRLKLFGQQLPEALDLIVRGLKAGHPVPVALAMVGQEMPDPIGSEFGMVADEITYGSDMTTALKTMSARVGHEDLPLFVTAVSIQTTTGGNLREILDGLAETIRGRVKLRRKIRAISTEGRMSAYILTAVPLLLVGAVLLIRPDYYNDVMGERLTYILIGVAVVLLLVGNASMFRMANFRF